MLETEYQAKLIEKIHRRIPGCVVLKNDTAFRQGIPDLTILYHDRWALLEVKPHKGARLQPNQRYYVELLSDMSFAAFIYPENEEEVLDDLQRAFSVGRPTRLSRR